MWIFLAKSTWMSEPKFLTPTHTICLPDSPTLDELMEDEPWGAVAGRWHLATHYPHQFAL